MAARQEKRKDIQQQRAQVAEVIADNVEEKRKEALKVQQEKNSYLKYCRQILQCIQIRQLKGK
jgi:hypothetical protein